MTLLSHSHTPTTFIHSSNSLSIAFGLRNSHSSSRFFFSSCLLSSRSLSTSVWSSSKLLFTSVLARPTTSMLLHNHIRRDCNTSVLPASGMFDRQRVGRFRQVVWVPIVCCFVVTSLCIPEEIVSVSYYWFLLPVDHFLPFYLS